METLVFQPFLIKTAFKRSKDEASPYFETFRENRQIIAQSFSSQERGLSPNDLDQNGYPNGYGKSQQEVVVPAFLAAYSGSNPNRPFRSILFKKFPCLIGI